MKRWILKQSQLMGLKTFGWEAELKIRGLVNPGYKILGFIVGKINNLQMSLDKYLRRKFKAA